jgi:hypothetical protein
MKNETRRPNGGTDTHYADCAGMSGGELRRLSRSTPFEASEVGSFSPLFLTTSAPRRGRSTPAPKASSTELRPVLDRYGRKRGSLQASVFRQATKVGQCCYIVWPAPNTKRRHGCCVDLNECSSKSTKGMIRLVRVVG